MSRHGDCLGTHVDAELVEGRLDVMIHGAGGEEELLADFLARVALGHQCDWISPTTGQGRDHD